MEASLAVHRQEGSQIGQSRDGSTRSAASKARRPWYRRAQDGLLLRRQPAPAVDAPPPAAPRATAARERPQWRASLKAAASAAARVACLCEPACSGVHADAVAPSTRRRRRTRSRAASSGGRSPPVAAPPVAMPAGEWESWRRAFRGTSLVDDILMRRFVLEEDATRRRVEMQEVARRCYGRPWVSPGPSRLSQMSLAGDVSEDDEAGEDRSTSPQCSEADQSL